MRHILEIWRLIGTTILIGRGSEPTYPSMILGGKKDITLGSGCLGMLRSRSGKQESLGINVKLKLIGLG